MKKKLYSHIPDRNPMTVWTRELQTFLNEYEATFDEQVNELHLIDIFELETYSDLTKLYQEPITEDSGPYFNPFLYSPIGFYKSMSEYESEYPELQRMGNRQKELLYMYYINFRTDVKQYFEGVKSRFLIRKKKALLNQTDPIFKRKT